MGYHTASGSAAPARRWRSATAWRRCRGECAAWGRMRRVAWEPKSKLGMRDGFYSPGKALCPSPGRPIRSFFKPGRGDRKEIFYHHSGLLCSAGQLAEPNRSAKASTYTARLRAASNTRLLAALQTAARKTVSVIHTSSLNTKALTQRSAHQSALRSPRSTHHHHPTRHSTWPTTPSPIY